MIFKEGHTMTTPNHPEENIRSNERSSLHQALLDTIVEATAWRFQEDIIDHHEEHLKCIVSALGVTLSLGL
jgi:hypothetical protein